MNSILIVKTSALGDITQSFLALSYLRKMFPNAQITWVVEKRNASLVKAHPYIDRVIEVDFTTWKKAIFSKKTRSEFLSFLKTLRKDQYDLLFDWQGNSKSGLINLFAKAKKKVGFSYKSVREGLNVLTTNIRYSLDQSLNMQKQILSHAQIYIEGKNFYPYVAESISLDLTQEEILKLELLQNEIHSFKERKGLTDKKSLMVAIGTKWNNKEMKLDQLISFLTEIEKEKNFSIFLVYSNPIEQKACEKIHKNFPERSLILPELSIPLFQHIMSKMDVIIAYDSFSLHLAGTANVMTFGIFGPTKAKIFNPNGDRHGFFQAPCPYGVTFCKLCPSLRTCSTGNCLHDVDLQALRNKFFRFWESVE